MTARQPKHGAWKLVALWLAACGLAGAAPSACGAAPPPAAAALEPEVAAGRELLAQSERPPAAPALLRRACDLGEADACLELSRLHRRGVVLVADLGQARAYASRACLAEGARGCAELGRMQQRGQGGAIDLAAAIVSFRRGCDHGEARACFELGRATEHGRGVDADPARAYDHYRRAVRASEAGCAAADLDGCNLLGQLLREGSGTASDSARGLSLQRAACQRGHAAACVSWMSRGTSSPRFELPPPALDALAGACDNGAGDACLLLARREGEEPTKSGRSARELLDRGCELGHGPACNAAGLERFPPDERGRAELERACALGDAPGCHSLGRVVELEGDGFDAGPAVEHHRRACQAGLAAACTRLGSLRASAVGGAADAGAARTSWERGCGLGDPRGCFELGVVLQEGTEVARDAKAGRDYLERACRGGERAACTRLGTRLWQGRDGEHDPTRGQLQLIAACEQGEPQACLELSAAARRGEAIASPPGRLGDWLAAAGLRSAALCEDAIAVCRDGAVSTSTETVWIEVDGALSRVLRSAPECGIGLERRCEQAQALLTERCAADAAACFRAARLLGNLLARGLGGRAAERERLEAEGLRRASRACAEGDAPSCRLAAEPR